MTKTLQTKHIPAGIPDYSGDGHPSEAHTLYRFVDADGKGGCWYRDLDRAEKSWTLWAAGADGRARRAAENERLAAAVRANARDASDPFSVFDR